MGSRYIRQHPCVHCGRLTHDYCDYCFRYLCEDHRVYKAAQSGLKRFVFCEECAAKNRKPLDPEGRQI